MLSTLKLAFALGGKVHGDGVLAPAPGCGSDDLSMSIRPNDAGDDYIVDPAVHHDYVAKEINRAIAASKPAIIAESRPLPGFNPQPIDFSESLEPHIQLVSPYVVEPDCIEQVLSDPAAPMTVEPNLIDINRHLSELFLPKFAVANPDAKIEIAFANPKTGNDVNAAKIFSVFDLEKAAAFAVKKNADGYNLYVAPALRIASHISGRAKGEHVTTSRFAWCEFDKAGDAERVAALCKAHLLWPAVIVTTGTIPYLRQQLYFSIEGVPPPADLTAMGAGLKALFGTDAVHNADRVLRLAGSINWPTPAKIARGYQAELTKLRRVPESPRYHISQLINLSKQAGAADAPNYFEQQAIDNKYKSGRTNEEVLELLERTRGVGDWHTPMLRAIASMISYGWTNFQIRLSCSTYCTKGVNDKDLDPMIHKRRIQLDIPDPATPEGIAKSEVAKLIGPHVKILATPYVWIDPANLPLRDWLYGRLLVRQFLSMTIAPGGVGKSSLVVGEVLAIVTGRNLLGVTPGAALKVWLWNLEDPQVETTRKIQAACIEHGIKREEIEGRLFVNSGRDQPLVIAKTLRTGAVIVHPVIDDLVRQIKEWDIDVLVIDPFVSCHEVGENDNSAIDMVAKQWSRVAELGDCAVHIVHHTRKAPAGTEVTTESGRGAKALSDAARIARALNRMSDEQAVKAGVDNPRSYFRAINDKANLAPPTSASEWFRLAGVPLGNGPFGMAGDDVGVIVRWDWPDHTAGVTGNDFDRVAAVIRCGKWRSSPQAGQWVGQAVAQGLGLDIGDKRDKAKVSSLIKYWISTGALVEVQADDEKRMPRMFVEVKSEQ